MSSREETQEDGDRSWLGQPLPMLGVLVVAAALGVPTLMLGGHGEIDYENRGPVSYEQAEKIVAKRCQPCHAEQPTSDTVQRPPAGVTLETPKEIRKFSKRIMVRAVRKKDMPVENETGMTARERETLGAWIHQGADLDRSRIKKAATE